MDGFRSIVPLSFRKTAARWLNDTSFFQSFMQRRYLARHHGFALGRVACVGRDVFQLKCSEGPDLALLNLQKARVDLFMDIVEGKCAGPVSRKVEPYLARKDIYPMVVEQRFVPWNVPMDDGAFLVMDSFAELTDQRFTHMEGGWSFCCHYSDIDHGTDFDQIFRCDGRLDENAICNQYHRFFTWLFRQRPNLPVYFISYSVKFDPRPEFAVRAKMIDEAISKISAEYRSVRHIIIDDDDYIRNENDGFPYHYGVATYKKMVSVWNRME